MKNTITIKAGTSKLRAKSTGEAIPGWHKFSKDCEAHVRIAKRTYTTILVVTSGEDKGTYVFQS